MNQVYNDKHGPMSQFWVLDTASGRRLMTHGTEFNYMWGFSRVLRMLPR